MLNGITGHFCLPALVCGHMHRNIDTLHVGICRYIALLREAQGMTPEEASDNFQAIFRACSTDHEVCSTRPQPSKQPKHPSFKFIETHTVVSITHSHCHAHQQNLENLHVVALAHALKRTILLMDTAANMTGAQFGYKGVRRATLEYTTHSDCD